MSDSEPTHYEISASRISPKRTRVDTGDAEFVVGKDVTPVEYLLGSVLACLNSTATVLAHEMDIDIQSLEATIEGELNDASYRGEDATGRAGFRELAVTLSVETETDADLDAWLAAVEARCPVSDTVENETDLTIELD